MSNLDITPDPKILLALANTNMEPIDALCELIDNAIDSFSHAHEMGVEISCPTVTVDIPSARDIKKGEGKIRVIDNGPGMTIDALERSIRAGYSGNNAYDNLGLFGMGFNISTSKFGIHTRVLTARPNEECYIRVDLDLQDINRTKKFQVPYEIASRQLDRYFGDIGTSGTIVEIDKWWPRGNPNENFAYNLAKINVGTIRNVLGRRYATILADRNRKIDLKVNDQSCRPYEHCVWSKERSVVKNGVAVPAKIEIDETIGTIRKCKHCQTEVPCHEDMCPECKSREIRTVRQRIWGWVGIQRFDHSSEYGIDLIRNGRCICCQEKDAFFFYKDDEQRQIKDYPIDSGGTNGRIVGEIHIDFVPVVFTKVNFVRESVEWQKAITFLRGETSLQPSKIPEGKSNESCIFRLYQAYRRADPGLKGLYMGIWDVTKNGPVRVSREKEKEYYQKFLAHEPGYYDDEEWFKLVESASRPPQTESQNVCPHCRAEILPENEICPFCDEVIRGKNCCNCNKEIPKSAEVCPLCGAEQNVLNPVDVDTPVPATWYCELCKARNIVGEEKCSKCGALKGTRDPISREYLHSVSEKQDELSFLDFTIDNGAGEICQKVSLSVYYTHGKITKFGINDALPFIEFRSPDSVELYVDPTHPQFARGRVAIKETISEELAHFVLEFKVNDKLLEHNRLSIIAARIRQDRWPEDFVPDRRRIQPLISELMRKIKDRLVEEYEDDDNYFEDLDKQSKDMTLQEFVSNRIPANQYSDLCKNGGFLQYVPDEFIYKLYCEHTADFFRKGIFCYAVDEGAAGWFSSDAITQVKHQYESQIRCCLQVLATFSQTSVASLIDSYYIALAYSSVNILTKRLCADV